MSLYKRGSTWWTSLRFAGWPRIQVSTGTSVKSVARELEATLRALVAAGRRDLVGQIMDGRLALADVHDGYHRNREALEQRVQREASPELGPLADDVVLVGGCAPAMYAMARIDVRETRDIDLIVKGSYVAWHEFMQRLRSRGFLDRPGRTMCRLAKDDLLLDIMPVDEPALGTNRWYRDAFECRMSVPDLGIHVVSPILFIATKLEAFSDPVREFAGDILASQVARFEYLTHSTAAELLHEDESILHHHAGAHGVAARPDLRFEERYADSRLLDAVLHVLGRCVVAAR